MGWKQIYHFEARLFAFINSSNAINYASLVHPNKLLCFIRKLPKFFPSCRRPSSSFTTPSIHLQLLDTFLCKLIIFTQFWYCCWNSSTYLANLWNLPIWLPILIKCYFFAQFSFSIFFKIKYFTMFRFLYS